MTDADLSELKSADKTDTLKIEDARKYCSINNIHRKKFSNKFKTEISLLLHYVVFIHWCVEWLKSIWERKCLGFNSSSEKHQMWLIENIFVLVVKLGLDIPTILAILKVPGAASDERLMEIVSAATSAGLITAYTPGLPQCK